MVDIYGAVTAESLASNACKNLIKSNCMSAPPLDSTTVEMWYKCNYTLSCAEIKEI
jgi:hypothetical protein